jgi:hypothetical protein
VTGSGGEPYVSHGGHVTIEECDAVGRPGLYAYWSEPDGAHLVAWMESDNGAIRMETPSTRSRLTPADEGFTDARGRKRNFRIVGRVTGVVVRPAKARARKREQGRILTEIL